MFVVVPFTLRLYVSPPSISTLLCLSYSSLFLCHVQMINVVIFKTKCINELSKWEEITTFPLFFLILCGILNKSLAIFISPCTHDK